MTNTVTNKAKRPSLISHIRWHLFPRHYRRRDKLKLWVALITGIAVPIMTCWLIPNFALAQRERTELQHATATAIALTAWNKQYADLFPLCDNLPSADAWVPPPARLQVLIVQKGSSQSVFQSNLPASWQPNHPNDVSVVVCLGDESIQATDTCLDGYKPDLSVYGRNVIQRGANRSMEVDYTLQRYATPITLLDVETGGIIAQSQIWGSDPPVCAGFDSMDFAGERLTAGSLVDWLNESLPGT